MERFFLSLLFNSAKKKVSPVQEKLVDIPNTSSEEIFFIVCVDRKSQLLKMRDFIHYSVKKDGARIKTFTELRNDLFTYLQTYWRMPILKLETT